MKAISIRQPWAWLIVHGYKDIENRTWRTNHRGPILIHAGKAIDPDYPQIYRFCADHSIELPLIAQLPKGGIVGAASITDCVVHSSSVWFEGPYGFILEDAQPLPFHSMRGQLGIFSASYNDTPIPVPEVRQLPLPIPHRLHIPLTTV